MKHFRLIAAAIVFAMLPWGAAVRTSAAASGYESAATIQCKIKTLSFNTSYTVRATRECKAGGKLVPLVGKWSWKVSVGDYGGYPGSLGPSEGKGSSFSLPVKKLTGGRLSGFNPPGVVTATFMFTSAYRGSPVKVMRTTTWRNRATYLMIGGHPPMTWTAGSGPATCVWGATKPSFNGATLKAGSISCSGGSSPCVWSPGPKLFNGQYYIAAPWHILCGSSEFHTVLFVFYSTDPSQGHYECADNWQQVSSYTTSHVYGPGQIYLQAKVETNGSRDLWQTDWVSMNGTVDPCTSDWK